MKRTKTMTFRLRVVCVAAVWAATAGIVGGAGMAAAAPAPIGPFGQDGQSAQGARVTRTIKVGPGSSLAVSNLSGNIAVTGGSGHAIHVDAIKHVAGDEAGRFGNVRVEITEHGDRVEVRTLRFSDRHASVDYTVTVPVDTSVYIRSISGDLHVTNVHGSVRAESVSGNVTADRTPHLDRLRSVSGNVSITGVSSDGDLTTGSISGTVTARDIKVQRLDLSTISGNLTLDGITCSHLRVGTVSGEVRYTGSLVGNGRYEITSHSGDVRLRLAAQPGFELNASSFSGDINSQFPITMSGGESGGFGRHTVRGTYGNASALVTIRTFSGDITIQRH